MVKQIAAAFRCYFTRLLGIALAVGAALALALPARAESPHAVYLPLVGKYVPGLLADPEWVSPFGIDMYGDISDAAGLARMKAAGASWVVTMLSWADVQPSAPTDWRWDWYDEKFLRAKNAGMDVCVLLVNVPEWARGSYPYPGGGPGMDLDALAAFVREAAERYDGDGTRDAPGSPVVKYWSFFAEPDYGVEPPRRGEEFKGGWGKHGAEYAAMLARVYQAIKAVAPDAVVMNGGIAFDYFTDTVYPTPTNPNRTGIYYRHFMADAIAAGADQHMDMLAVHYYPVTMASWPDKLRALYETGASRGVETRMRSRTLISPEMGFWSYPPDPNGAGEREQANRLVQMFVRGLSVGVQRLAWFAVFDGPPHIPTELHGLFRNGDLNDPKPAYWAYRTMAQQLHGFRYSGPAHEEATPSPTAWRYEAYWFYRRADGARKLVAWANRLAGESQAPTVTIPVLARRVQVVTNPSRADLLEAAPVVIVDGGPGDLDRAVDGFVRLLIGEEPVYITVE
jgi:hypothetical protein